MAIGHVTDGWNDSWNWGLSGVPGQSPDRGSGGRGSRIIYCTFLAIKAVPRTNCLKSQHKTSSSYNGRIMCVCLSVIPPSVIFRAARTRPLTPSPVGLHGSRVTTVYVTTWPRRALPTLRTRNPRIVISEKCMVLWRRGAILDDWKWYGSCEAGLRAVHTLLASDLNWTAKKPLIVRLCVYTMYVVQ